MLFVGKEFSLYYSDVDDTLDSGTLTWNPLIDNNKPATSSSASTLTLTAANGSNGGKNASKEEQLQWERKRTSVWGITEFQLLNGRLVYPANGSIFLTNDSTNAPSPPVELQARLCFGAARLNATMCPANPDLVAFVGECDLWVQHVVTGQEVRLTRTHRGGGSLANDPISSGLPSYVMQEEFNRFTGFWWRPVKRDGRYYILYEEVDESEVPLLKFPHSGSSSGDVEEFRFPAAGSVNAVSTIKVVSFALKENSAEIVDVKLKELREPLRERFDWAEYLVRMGWTPGGEHVWAQLLDRRQKKLELVLMPFERSFADVDETMMMSIDGDKQLNGHNGSFASGGPVQVIHRISAADSDSWVRVNDILKFIPSRDNDDNELDFIWANEETGYRHLYHVTVLINKHNDDDNNEFPTVKRKVALTSGSWSVLDSGLEYDPKRRLVYFRGLRESPLEKHFYVVSLDQPLNVKRLTHPGYSHSVCMSEDCSAYVSVFSSITDAPAARVFRVAHDDDSADGVNATALGWVVEPRDLRDYYRPPELFSHRIRRSDDVHEGGSDEKVEIHGMIFKPPNFDASKKYPVVVSVYGGPEVQVVSNSFKGVRQMRNHLLASQGYCVVCIDSRGSVNRGAAFEEHLKLRMGQVEMKDQVEVLTWLDRTVGYLDMKRVAVHGWSYGGYLSLMGLVQFPGIFKVFTLPSSCIVARWHVSRPEIGKSGNFLKVSGLRKKFLA